MVLIAISQRSGLRAERQGTLVGILARENVCVLQWPSRNF